MPVTSNVAPTLAATNSAKDNMIATNFRTSGPFFAFAASTSSSLSIGSSMIIPAFPSDNWGTNSYALDKSKSCAIDKREPYTYVSYS